MKMREFKTSEANRASSATVMASFLRIVPSSTARASPGARTASSSPRGGGGRDGDNHRMTARRTTTGDENLLVVEHDDYQPSGTTSGRTPRQLVEDGCPVLVLNLLLTKPVEDGSDGEDGDILECTFAAVCRVVCRGADGGKKGGDSSSSARRRGRQRQQHHRTPPRRVPASPAGGAHGEVVVGRLHPHSLERRFFDSSSSSSSPSPPIVDSHPRRDEDSPGAEAGSRGEVEVETRTVVVPLYFGCGDRGVAEDLAERLCSILVADASSVVLGPRPPDRDRGAEKGEAESVDVFSMSKGQVRMLEVLARLELLGDAPSLAISAGSSSVAAGDDGPSSAPSSSDRRRLFAVGDVVDVPSFMGSKLRFAIHSFVPRRTDCRIIEAPMDVDECVHTEDEGAEVAELGRTVGDLALVDDGDGDRVSKVEVDCDRNPSPHLNDAETLVRLSVDQQLRLQRRVQRARHTPLLCRIHSGTKITFVEGRVRDVRDRDNHGTLRATRQLPAGTACGDGEDHDGSWPDPNRSQLERQDREGAYDQDESPPCYVAGLSDVMNEVERALVPSLRHPELFWSYDDGGGANAMRAPRGVLLYGPGGVGKSALAKQIGHRLAASSTSPTSRISGRNEVSRPPPLPVCVRTVQCGTLVSFVVGESEGRLVRLFRSAELRCVQEGVSTLLILDDVHLVCPRRGGGGGSSSSTDRVAATLLALMDGIGEGESLRRDHCRGRRRIGNVTILAITTDPSLLDPALRRPGRLDREVEVPVPDDAARAEILSFQLRRCLGCGGDAGHQTTAHQCLASDEGAMLALARRARGFTGADTLLAIREASRQALLRNSKMRSWSGNSGNFDGDQNREDGGTEVAVGRCEVTLEDLQRAISRSNPTSIRGVAVEIPAVRWSDIGGMHDVKRLLREAVELPSTHPHLFDSLGIAPPGGVLLYGPPGCSKTLMARALATEGGMNFLAVKGPELLSKWLGESERTLASLFRRARRASPCVIFFDEIDAIASRRGGGESGSSSGGERLLSQLLTELDGVSSSSMMSRQRRNERVVVVGATNRPDLLDPALTRPGRIDRMIYVGIPDCESREMILEIGLRGRCCHGDIDISHLATEGVTGGYSGAELVSICRDAALRALEEYEGAEEEATTNNNGTYGDHPMIAMRHIMDSIRDTKRQISSEMLHFYSTFRNKK